MRAGAALVVASLLGLAALQQGLPDRVPTTWGLEPASVARFQEDWFGVTWPRMSPDYFVLGFWLLTVSAWAGYMLVLGAGLRGGILNPRRTLVLVAILGGILAVFAPPTLSSDTYAYAGYARMEVLYGLNPYLHTPKALEARGDPTADVLAWNIPCVYGPIWLLPSFAITCLLHPFGLGWEVIAFKLVEALALVGAALAARSVARHFDPTRADLTLAAIGLNPLFLIEGPMSGHNDLLMMTLILAAAALFLKHRDAWGALVLGLAVGIKLIPLVLVPWLMLESGRRRPGLAGLGRALLVVLLVLTPTALAYAPLWEGVETFTAQRVRVTNDWTPVEAGTPLLQQMGSIVLAKWPLVLLYLGLSFGVWWRGRDGDWLTAWAVLAVALMFLIMLIPYPWYLMWPLAVLLTRWDREHAVLSAACLGLAVVWTLGYTAEWP
jgi:hypothetical protein